MANVEIVNFDSWVPYEGFSEGSGRSEKIWLQSREGKIGLFKYPKFDTETSEVTTEYISEHLAYRVGNIIGIKTAVVDIGVYHNRIGSMSHLINSANEAVVEGSVVIAGKHLDYDSERMQETFTGKYYCIDHLLEVSNSPVITNKWIEMMIFDYLIGNTDRHQNNWALLVIYDQSEQSLLGRVCPLYDNGSSLCAYVNEKQIPAYLGNDVRRFEALADRQSLSMIRIDGFVKKRPSHLQVIEHLFQHYPYALIVARHIVDKMTAETIDDLLKEYDGILSVGKIELIKKYLTYKTEILKDRLMKVQL